MVERAYTLTEIDQMRANLYTVHLNNVDDDWDDDEEEYMWEGQSSPNPKKIEEELRTYLLAGIDPSELEKAAKEAEQRTKEREAKWLAARIQYKLDIQKESESLRTAERLADLADRKQEAENLAEKSKKPSIFDSSFWTGK